MTTLGRLKNALRTDRAQMEWAMDPVLDYLRAKLSPEDHALLTELVAALSYPEKVTGLEAFSPWSESSPEPLE